MTSIDIIFLILFIIVISVIIGLNIISVIDKKISSVSINIPDQKIVLNIEKDKSSGKLKISEQNSNDNLILDIDKEDKKENFIVSDVQNINEIDKHLSHTQAVPNSFQSQSEDPEEEINQIDVDCQKCVDKCPMPQVVYGTPPIKKTFDKKKCITSQDFGWSPPRQYIGCQNSSISDKFKTGPKRLLPFNISCDRPNKLTAENYYKTYYNAESIPIEDYEVRGYNYSNYSKYYTPAQERYARILSQNTKGLTPLDSRYPYIPTGFNYAFHNTPAMPMP